MRPRPELAAATAGAVVLTGVQGIVPALPELQRALGLDDPAVSLVMLVYVLAGAVSAIPAGALADRIGARPVMVVALVAFGLVSIAPVVVPETWMLVLARTVQGASFGVVLSLSVSVLADSVDRSRQAAAQSRRVVVMSSTEAALPLFAGVLVVAAGWQSALLLGALALPVAVLCWWGLPAGAPVRHLSGRASLHLAVRAATSRDGLGVQALGFVRFLLKFAALSFLPILADRAGLGAAAIGLAFSAGAVLGIGIAALAPALLRRIGVTAVLVGSLLLAAGPFLAAPLANEASMVAVILVIIIVLISSIGDALLGVATNVVAAAAAPAGARGSFIGITSTVRNTGKVMAPALVAILVLAIPLSFSVAMLGTLGLAALLAVPRAVRAADAPEQHPGRGSSSP